MSSNLTEFITDHVRLKHRIYSGYLLIGLVSLLIVLTAHFSFHRTAGEFSRFALYSQQTQTGLELANKVSELHRAAEIFTHEGLASEAEKVHHTHGQIRQLIDEFSISMPPRIQPHIRLINSHLATYIETFDQFQAQRDRQSFLVRTEIRRHASNAETLIQRYLGGLSMLEVAPRTQAVQVLNSILQVEKHAYRYFDSLDAQHISRVKLALRSIGEGLRSIQPTLVDGEGQGVIESLQATMHDYELTFLEAVQRTRGYLYLVNVVMAAETFEILYQARLIADLQGNEMQVIEREILHNIGQVIQTVLILGLLSLAVIVLLSYVIGNSITAPITRLTQTFNALSQGSSSADIPNYRLHDEMGDLSHAAGVFRDRNNETRELLYKYRELSGNLEKIVEQRTRELETSNRKLITARDAAESAAHAKSDFLANMSHEIRTPMHAIIGMTHLIAKTPLDERQQKFIRNIQSSGNTLLGLINDILDFSKIEAGKLTIERIDFDLHATLDQVASLVGMQASEKNLEFVISYSKGLPRRYIGDPMRLAQVLTNLINNAVKFTDSGEVGIDVQRGRPGHIGFAVHDTGIGISTQDQEKLFAAFTQADESITRKYGGTGLGLAISRQLVVLMGGSISVDSEAGVGSRFFVEVPLQELDDEEPCQLLRGKTVLLADPSLSSRKTLTSLCEELGMQVRAVGSIEEALNGFNDDQEIDLALIDRRYLDPMKAGAKKLIDRIADLGQVLLLTPINAPDSLAEELARFNHDRILAKPVNPSRFADQALTLMGLHPANHSPEQVVGDESLLNISTLRGSRILLVDDNRMNRDIVHGMLDSSGIEIDDAANGRLAVEMHLANKDIYDLVLMDIQMPEMDGYEATRNIRRIDPNLPIIALTADALISDMEKTRAVGMNEHINKPIDVEKLFAMLLKYIPARTESEQPSQWEKASFPGMRNVDTRAGLKRLLGDTNLYTRQLLSFVEEYAMAAAQYSDLLKRNRAEAKALVHSIKGVSGNIGASLLFEAAGNLEKEHSEENFQRFRDTLDNLVVEIKDTPLPMSEGIAAHGNVLGTQRRTALLQELHQVVERRRPQRVKPLIDELSSYRLDSNDSRLLKRLAPLISKYKYREAAKLLEHALNEQQ